MKTGGWESSKLEECECDTRKTTVSRNTSKTFQDNVCSEIHWKQTYHPWVIIIILKALQVLWNLTYKIDQRKRVI